MRSPGRGGFTLLEVMIAIALLAAGGTSALRVMRGARGVLGASQEALRLQLLATRVFEQAQGMVASGGLMDLGPLEERRVQEEEAGAQATASLIRNPVSGGYEVMVEAGDGTLSFSFRAALADPLACAVGAPRATVEERLQDDPFLLGGHP